jgi:hypothetical protein
MTILKATDREIEERYETGILRLTQERNDFLLPQVLDFVKTNKWLNLHPEYQRRLVWDAQKRSLFIESLLMNIPIPPIFLFEWEYSRYEVMDGQQRLSTIVDFYDNRFRLKGLEKWPDLNGRTYADCPPVIQRGLDRRRISAVVLLAENLSFEKTKYDVRRIVFERLNTGGQNLNAQELRNCLYSGTFNDLIIQLAGDDLFDDIWEIPRYTDNIRSSHVSTTLANHQLYRRMQDCEIVLRFFAFRNKSNIRGSVKSILDRCMESERSVTGVIAEQYKELFLTRLQLCHKIFGRDAFRISDGNGRSKLSQPLYDATMIAIDRLYDYADLLIEKSNELTSALRKALVNPNIYEIIVARPNTAESIKKRLDIVEQIIRGCL